MTNYQLFYQSTNKDLQNGNQGRFSFQEALLTGLAPDDGLFVFNQIPQLDFSALEQLRGRAYHELAYYILELFLRQEIPADQLKNIVQTTYAPNPKWERGVSIPLELVKENTFIARLDQGPTASFKDFAAQFMARLFDYYRKPNQQITILVATSGDTGSAVGEAFKGLEGIKVYILYPKNEVSPIQKHQLETIGDNVITLSIDAKFDDCQAFVKQAFLDPELSGLNLSSANSINIGRLIPQAIYYVYIYLQISRAWEPLVFSIPSGNLGNSLACEIARRMGLPVKKILIATNANNAFPKFLQTGAYHKISPSLECVSNAMNVGNPSNLARYFHLFGGIVDKSGNVFQAPDLHAMREVLSGYDFSDEQTLAAMQKVYREYQILLEPHGAIGWLALEQFELENPELKHLKKVIIETAHPAKFPETIEDSLSISPENTPFLQAIQEKTGYSIAMPNDYTYFKNFLLQNT
ncbi:MAG: threonine synthase [Microscillaceae bacterium]|nr:threonine synthase [Microscillaceae bacterium]